MSCEKNCLLHERSKKVLLSVCIGMKKYNKTFLIEKEEAHAKCPQIELKRMFMPSKNNLVMEIVRRHYSSHDSVKKCKSWTISKCKDWLVNNPVTEVKDMQFLVHEEGLLVRLQRKVTKNLTMLIN